MLSGIVKISRYPLAAQTKARAIPVLPEVGSTSTVPGLIRPAVSAAAIIETPIRSLTESNGLKNSHFARISALTPASRARRWMRTSGVAPIVSAMLS